MFVLIILLLLCNSNMFKINAFSSNFRVPSIRKLGTLRSIRIMRNSRMPRMKSIMNLQRLSTSNIEENDAKIIDISVNWVEKWVIKYNLCPWAKTVLPYLRVKVLHNEPNNNFYKNEELYTEFIKLAQQLIKRQEIFTPGKEDEHVRTLLIVLPQFKDFATFYDTVQNVEDVLNQTGCGEFIQVASFHPDYKFASTIEYDDDDNFYKNDDDNKEFPKKVEDEDEEEVEEEEERESVIASYTNKSPYPMIHYLLVDDVKNAIDEYTQGHVDIEDNSSNNDDHNDDDRDTSDIWKSNIRKMEHIAKQVGGQKGMARILEEFKNID